MKGLRLYEPLLRNYSSVNNRVTYYCQVSVNDS